MLSFKPVSNAKDAAHYFSSTDDYYSNENENTVDEKEAGLSNAAEAAATKGKGMQPGVGGAKGSKDGPGQAADEDGAQGPRGPGAGAANGASGQDIGADSARKKQKKGTQGAEPPSPGDQQARGPGKSAGKNGDDLGDLKRHSGHKGVWMGKGAEALGLHGKASSADFLKLLNGQLPDGTQVRKGKTHGSKDRPGIDFTLSAPKSISIQALVTGDKRLIAAHDTAVRAAMAEMERHAVARKKENGKSTREFTGKLVMTSFRHELSRAQDPQIHTHNVVMNMTQRADGEWRALSNEDMLRNVKVVGAFYRAHLADEVRKLGYQLRETQKGGWELADVSDKAVDLFSSRSKEIERLLKARGQDRDSATTMQKQIIALATREKKTDVDRALLRKYWSDTAAEAGVDLRMPETSYKAMVTEGFEKARDYVTEKVTGKVKGDDEATHAVNFAIAHLAERQGIFPRKELLEVAYGKAATRSTIVGVDKAIEQAKADGRLIAELPLYQTARSLNRSTAAMLNDPTTALFKGHDEYERLTRNSWIVLTMNARGLTREQAEGQVDDAIKRGNLVQTEERYTTREAKRSEIKIIGMERLGRGTVGAMASSEAVDRFIAASTLNAGQGDAVRMIMTSENRFVGVQGIAGTGKSHMLAETMNAITASAVQASKDQGFKVIGIAPYASQSQELEKLGMGAITVASFLARRTEHAKLDAKSILVLDEASTVPAHQMERLMSIVERQGARMVMVGDKKQTQAVEAGKPFEQLQNSGMSMAYMSEIQRQKNETIKAAVVHAANDRIDPAVKMLKGHTTAVRDERERHKMIARDYAALSPEERAKTLVVAGTNDARKSIGGMIRDNLGLRDEFKGVRTLVSEDMTRAELKEAASYRLGRIVVPEGQYKGGQLVKGEQYEVIGNDLKSNQVYIRDRHGVESMIDPAKMPMLGVYTRSDIGLARGEHVVITRNDKAIGVHRGEKFNVETATDKTVVLANDAGKRIELSRDKDLHLRYAYVSTVHAAQGATNDRVLIEANTKSLTANKAVFYVAISRPRHDLRIYTDDASKLTQAMSREPKKYAALELRDEKNERFFLRGRIDHATTARFAARVRNSQPPTQTAAQTKNTATNRKGRSM